MTASSFTNCIPFAIFIISLLSSDFSFYFKNIIPYLCIFANFSTEKPYLKRFSGIEKSTVILSKLRWTCGGQGGIRTHEPLARLPDFESGPL